MIQAAKSRDSWIALTIGNSRLHWAYFQGHALKQCWTAPHQSVAFHQGLPGDNWRNWLQFSPAFVHHQSLQAAEFPPLWVASVVPSQSLLWQTYPNVRVLGLEDIPLQQTYATLGIDRALALWGAGMTYGWPALVIDGGTALTLTGADANGRLVGGAILPGLALQVRSLSTSTAALPAIVLPQDLPPRWATDTPSAIQTGIIHILIAGLFDAIRAWWAQHPDSWIVITGGDHLTLFTYLQAWQRQIAGDPPWKDTLVQDVNLMFRGMNVLKQRTVGN